MQPIHSHIRIDVVSDLYTKLCKRLIKISDYVKSMQGSNNNFKWLDLYEDSTDHGVNYFESHSNP